MPNENLKAQKIYGKYIKDLPQVTEVNDTDDIIIEDSTPVTNRTKLGVLFDSIKKRIASNWRFTELNNQTIVEYASELNKNMTDRYVYAYTTYLDVEKSTKTSLTLKSIKATGHGRKCILMCWGATRVTTLTASLSVYVNNKECCSGITASASYVPVFDSNIITLPQGENTIEIRLSAQANTATAYIGRYHKLGFIVAEL